MPCIWFPRTPSVPILKLLSPTVFCMAVHHMNKIQDFPRTADDAAGRSMTATPASRVSLLPRGSCGRSSRRPVISTRWIVHPSSACRSFTPFKSFSVFSNKSNTEDNLSPQIMYGLPSGGNLVELYFLRSVVGEQQVAVSRMGKLFTCSYVRPM